MNAEFDLQLQANRRALDETSRPRQQNENNTNRHGL
jgi:hypothetical protein